MNLAADIASRGAVFILGILIFISVTVSLLRTVVVPRPLRSLFSDTVKGAVVGTTRLIARTRGTYERRDAVLAWAGPLLILGMLLAWLIGYIVAYSFMLYGISQDRSIGQAFRQAGSSLLTLGLVGAKTGEVTFIDFMAAATGPIVIAMLIGFLPTVYSIYIERERLIAELALRAGEPTWGPEMIARAQMADSMPEMDAEYDTWASWATTLRMTHTTYPVLLHIRSPRFTRHFSITLLALLDAAALQISLSKDARHRNSFHMLLHGSQAFDVLYVLFFQKRRWYTRIPIIGRRFLHAQDNSYETFSLPAWERRMAAVHEAAAHDTAHGMSGIVVSELVKGEAQPITLTRAEFDDAVDMIAAAGFPIDRDRDEAWAMFRRIRQRYEFPAYAITKALAAAPAPWSGPRRFDTPTLWPKSAVAVLAEHPADESDRLDG